MSTVLVGRRALDMISEAHVFIFLCVCVCEWQDKLHANDCFAATIGTVFFLMGQYNANVKKRVMASALLCASVWAQTVASGIILLVLAPK